MIFDTWIIAYPADWEAINPGPEEPAPWAAVYATAVRGRWKPGPGGREVHNVLGSPVAVSALLARLEAETPGTVSAVYSWTQGRGDSRKAEHPHTPAEIVALMQDHIMLDEGGAETGRIPATEENPNWGHVFFGQERRFFAGPFNAKFNYKFR